MKKTTNYIKHFAGLFALALMLTMMVGIRANAAGTTYYVNKTTIFKLYSDSACTSAVDNDTVLQGGDTIVCANVNGSYAFEIFRESEQQYVGYDFLARLEPGESYTIPDGSYEWDDSEGNFVLNRIDQPTEPETPPADPETPPSDPAIPSEPTTSTSIVEKTEEEAPTLTLPVLKSTNYAGDELASWQEVIDALVTIEPKKLTDSKPQDTESVLKVDISSTAGFVGHEVLQTLAKKDDASLHVFTGNGVAITFAGADMKEDAKAVRVTNQVSDKEENGKRVHIVDFLEKGKMEATVAFHVNLPQGANSSVEVYTENKDGVQNHIKTMKADSTGNVAFMIDSKEKFVFKY